MKNPYAKTVGYELLHAARLHRARAAKLLSEVGLFPGQEQVLIALAGGPRTMGDLATELRVRPPTASKTIARLAAQGLVDRKAEDADARVVRVELTQTGHERAAALEALWERLETEAVEDLDNKDRRRLRKLLRKVARNLSGSVGAVPDEEMGDEATVDEA